MRRVLRFFAVAAVACAVAGCAVMSSELLELSPERGCQSGAGTYYLPKTNLKVTVERLGTTADYWHQIKISKIRVPDRHFGYCLDYLARATSDDIVQIKRYAGTQLLGVISTDTLDQSGAILSTLVRAVLGGVAGRARGADAIKEVVFDADYDPFEPVETATINEALRRFGFCLLLETDLAGGHGGVQKRCNAPLSVVKTTHRQPYQTSYKDRLPPEKRGLPGIFYRPRIPYNYFLFVRDNPAAQQSPWELRESAVVEMENVAPILAARVDRAFFAQRKTTLMFDEGMLKDVCIYKSSELLEVSKLVLDVTKSVVALPTQVVQVRIDQVTGEGELARSELELLKTQKSYRDLLDGVPNHQAYNPKNIGSPYHKGTLPGVTPLVRAPAEDSSALQQVWASTCPKVARNPIAAPSNAIGAIVQ